ncbi:sugar phosphate isomerase/epimerase [Thermatribacter velox]|uniref:Sugar phosphate isomerase/epimerase n=1 Tax=Thermatribacter velox TaxID=3039681 RepID=A0ABZ2Y9Y7_9BACT
MKKGINQWSFPQDMPVLEVLQRASKYRFQGVELCPDEDGIFPIKTNSEELKRIGNLASDLGIEICSLATGLLWKYNLASNDPSKREKAKDVIKYLIEMAAQLGASSVLVIPGYVNVPWDPSSEIVHYQDALERVWESLGAMIPYAQSANVVLGIENVWNKFLLSPLEFAYFVDHFNSPFVKAHFDTGNVLVFGYPEQWIEILGKRIVKVHIKDFKLNVGNINGFCLPLEGDVSWPSVMKCLRNVGYDGYLIAEFIPPYRFHTEALLANISFNLDCIIGMV